MILLCCVYCLYGCVRYMVFVFPGKLLLLVSVFLLLLLVVCCYDSCGEW